jgi:hypothetical protein
MTAYPTSVAMPSLKDQDLQAEYIFHNPPAVIIY